MKPFFLLAIATFLLSFQGMKKNNTLFPKLQKYADELPKNFNQLDTQRQAKLKTLGDYILAQKKEDRNSKIVVICTHNSRRSHFGQVWLQVAAAYYGIDNIETFSGGTEATAFNPRAVAALERTGVNIEKLNPQKEEEPNPIYSLAISEYVSNTLMFSKKYTHSQNPQQDFIAVMVCSDADKNCPMVLGAAERIAIPFEDPKISDNTFSETQTYDERCKQIATECFFVMNYVKQNLK